MVAGADDNAVVAPLQVLRHLLRHSQPISLLMRRADVRKLLDPAAPIWAAPESF
jgi:hypothetical protein